MRFILHPNALLNHEHHPSQTIRAHRLFCRGRLQQVRPEKPHPRHSARHIRTRVSVPERVYLRLHRIHRPGGCVGGLIHHIQRLITPHFECAALTHKSYRTQNPHLPRTDRGLLPIRNHLNRLKYRTIPRTSPRRHRLIQTPHMLTPERGTLTAMIVRRSQGKRQSTLILREMGWLFRSFQGLQALIQLLLD